MFNYLEKYIKYKNKYLSLKQSGSSYQSIGGSLESCKYDYEVHVSEPWYTHIKEGRKTVEGRPKRKTFAEMQVGQTIKFFNKELNENFCAKIIEINEHKTFLDMIRSNGIENVLPEIRNLEEGVSVYRQYYDEEIESQYGVVGIKVQVI
jgi:ASC-1-like (ASCH) protein